MFQPGDNAVVGRVKGFTPRWWGKPVTVISVEQAKYREWVTVELDGVPTLFEANELIKVEEAVLC